MSEPFIGRHTIYGDDGTAYMTRAWIGRLRLHVFHRGDDDPDPHDHPWPFWTLPLTSYWEEIFDPKTSHVERQVVWAFRLHYRPAEYAHRVLRPHGNEAKIITLVWRGKGGRRWGFYKRRDGVECWEHWKSYILAGGRHAPCSPARGEDRPEPVNPT